MNGPLKFLTARKILLYSICPQNLNECWLARAPPIFALLASSLSKFFISARARKKIAVLGMLAKTIRHPCFWRRSGKITNPPKMSLTISFDFSFIMKQAIFNPALFLILQRINGVERFVKIDGYDHHSYAEIKLLMENKIASLDPTAKPLPWALFFGWDSELIPDLPFLSKDVLNDFSTEIPICVIGQSGHVAWVNQKAFEVGF